MNAPCVDFWRVKDKGGGLACDMAWVFGAVRPFSFSGAGVLTPAADCSEVTASRSPGSGRPGGVAGIEVADRSEGSATSTPATPLGRPLPGGRVTGYLEAMGPRLCRGLPGGLPVGGVHPRPRPPALPVLLLPVPGCGECAFGLGPPGVFQREKARENGLWKRSNAGNRCRQRHPKRMEALPALDCIAWLWGCGFLPVVYALIHSPTGIHSKKRQENCSFPAKRCRLSTRWKSFYHFLPQKNVTSPIQFPLFCPDSCKRISRARFVPDGRHDFQPKKSIAERFLISILC